MNHTKAAAAPQFTNTHDVDEVILDLKIDPSTETATVMDDGSVRLVLRARVIRLDFSSLAEQMMAQGASQREADRRTDIAGDALWREAVKDILADRVR